MIPNKEMNKCYLMALVSTQMWTNYGPIKTAALLSPAHSPLQRPCLAQSLTARVWQSSHHHPPLPPTFWTSDLQMHGDSLTAYQLSGFHGPINLSVTFLSMEWDKCRHLPAVLRGSYPDIQKQSANDMPAWWCDLSIVCCPGTFLGDRHHTYAFTHKYAISRQILHTYNIRIYT